MTGWMIFVFFVAVIYGGFCGWILRGEHDEEKRRENEDTRH